ncbi:MAG: LysM peptidoglycan-binding domain-containing protein [Negativicutes bacterium]|nr:LysM peptidoglycan-binding domain-containing protein [Negativicutes bacterium]
MKKLLLLIVAGAILVGSPVSAGSYPPGVALREVVINKGDTLWSVAARFCPDTVDIREYIADIVEINGIGPNEYLQPGQLIRVPGR